MNVLEAKKLNCSCIYRFVFPDGKCYVGQTKNLSDRIKLYERVLFEKEKDSSRVITAIRDFGFDNVSIEIIAKVSGLSREDELLCLSILEIKYIREFDSIENGYNVSIGAELLGIPSEFITTNNLSPYQGGNKPILCYDIDGIFVKEYDSIEKCAYSLGVSAKDVSECVNKRRSLFLNTYMLRYKKYNEIPDKILPFKPEYIEKTKVVINKVYKENVIYKDKVRTRPNPPVLKYNQNGDFCGEYETALDAALSVGRNSITKGKLIRGYIFFDHDGGEIKQNIGAINGCSRRVPKYSDALNADFSFNAKSSGWSSLINDFKVGCYSLDGKLIETYDSINHASEMSGVPYSSIWSTVFGRTKKGHGYIWRKVD